jgi:ribonuclease HI
MNADSSAQFWLPWFTECAATTQLINEYFRFSDYQNFSILDLVAHIDGGARGNPGPAAIGVIVHDAHGKVLFEDGVFIGHGTNNEAEYRALIHLLEMAVSDPQIRNSGAKKLRVCSDSLLVVNQILGLWKIKEPRLRELHGKVMEIKKAVPFELRIRHVPREENKDADRLVNEALDRENAEKLKD